MAYDYYGQGQGSQSEETRKRDAMLRVLGPNGAKTDFNLGGATPATTPAPPAGAVPSTAPAPVVNTTGSFSSPGSNKAVNGVVPSADPANWGSTQPVYGAPDPKIDYDKLGNRDYLDNTPGGSFWSDQLGPPPQGYVYNANGGLMKKPGWDKFDDVATAATIAGVSGGTLAAGVAPAVGGAIVNAATTADVPRDQMGNPFTDGRGAVDPNPAGGPAGTSTMNAPATNTAAATGTTDAAATPAAGGITLPAEIDTNGFAKPGYAVAGSPQAPPGWDQAKWANTAHQSPKYAVGRIMSQYPQTTEGLKQAMPEIIKAYPGATQTGEDTIKIPGVGEIDVVKAGGGFWWGAETDANGNPIPKSGAGDGGGDSAANLAAGYNIGGNAADSSTIAKIIERLGGLGGVKGKGGVISARDAVLNKLRV